MGLVLAVASQKGGVGKTTTAINLSGCLAAAEHRTLLIDLDPQGNSTSGLGVDKRTLERSVYDVLIDGMPAEQAVVRTELEQLDLLPSHADVTGAEVQLVPMPRREYRLREALAPVRDRYEFVIIDCPPSLGLLTLNALTAADSVLIPVQCEYYALEGLTQLLTTVDLVRGSTNAPLALEGALLTMYDARTNLSQQVIAEIRKHFPEKVFRTMVPRNVRLSEAPSHGRPIILYDIRSAGAEAYLGLAKEILAAHPTEVRRETAARQPASN